MKKVIIITWAYPPEAVGRASRTHELAKFLKKFYTVKVITPPPTWPFTKFKKARYLYRKEQLEGIDVLRIWNMQPSKLRPRFFETIGMSIIFPFLVSLHLIIGLHNVSTVIVGGQPTPILLITLVPRFFRKKIVLDIGDLQYDPKLEKKLNKRHKFIKKIFKKFEFYCWKKSDLILTNVLGISEKLKTYPHLSSKVQYLPYNIDTDHFKKLDVKKEKQLVYIGMFGPLQNLIPLIQAMKIVSSKIPNLKLKLYGGGSQELDLKELVSDLKLQDVCEIKNPVSREQIPLILSKSLMGIVSLVMDNSLNYATPTKLFEYLSCGLPVFSYGPSKAIEKILSESNSGIMIENDDPKIIAQSLIRILDKTEELEEFSKNGRKFIEKRIDYSHIAEII